MIRLALTLCLIALPAFGQDGMTVRELHAIFIERARADDQRVAAQEKAVVAALAAAKEAVDKAGVASEKRFDSVNEFRAALAQQQATLITRTEVDLRMRGVEEKIALLVGFRDTSAGRSEGVSAMWVAAGTVAGIAIGAVGLGAAWRRG